jgi:MoaA/NifB/PqqE/SkfB family radical SAM enzyme
MNFRKNNIIQPRIIRLEASTVCQLKCPSCPNAAGEIARHLGSGFLKFQDFKNIIDRNPWVSHIELSNWGEIFLNKELLTMVQYAYRKNVMVSASNGSNFNNVPEEVLEALVKYQFRTIKCSIDGASPETYSLYRVNGNFDRVMENIRKINKYKVLYQSPYPVMKWQFVAFGHNEHEIRSARRMAVDLNMEFRLKLSWDDLYGRPFSPIKDTELVRREAGVGAASRYEYRTKYGREYALRACCASLWKTPQINYDGRVLGCPVNYRGDYGNAFQDGLLESINNDRINYARQMLMGIKEAKEGIPCATCQSYRGMKETRSWLTPEEVVVSLAGMRRGAWLTENPLQHLPRIWRIVKRRLAGAHHGPRASARSSLTSRIDLLSLPLQPDEIKGWKPYAICRGPTKF